jgi:outer membrane protein OmpA-like peptidoglycan-associated protein
MRRLLMLGGIALLAGCAHSEPDSQRFPIFFTSWSADLDPEALGLIKHASEWATAHPNAPVLVSGFADPEGSPQANKDISRLRAQVVADQLVKDGVAATRVSQTAVGSVAFTLDSMESRRVEIVIGAHKD